MDYKFRISKPEEDDFVCEIAIRGDQTFQQFHDILTKELKFDATLMASFFPLDKTGERKREIALMEMYTGGEDYEEEYPMVMDVVNIREIVSADSCELEYVYDIFNDNYLQIEYIGEYFGDEQIKNDPICLICAGKLPTQESFDFTENLEEDSSNHKNERGNIDASFLAEFDDFGNGFDDEFDDSYSYDEGFSGHESLDDYLDKL